jgi:hypothetical protein
MIHGGVVFESLVNYLDKFGPEVLVIQSGFLVIVATLFLWLWFSNRRKYQNLKHAIPANVVKNYLDSIIQNSTALKSSLFRGGGLELGNIPSVLPLQNLGGGESLLLSGAPNSALLEELNQKKAMIASLEAQLQASQNAQREFEAKFNKSQQELAAALAKIKELEALLAKSKGGSGDEAIKAELVMVTRERDEIRDRLKEFEIISDDLANLKRLQQENEQLKRSLAAKGGSVPESVAAPVEAAPKAKKAAAEDAELANFLDDIGTQNKNPGNDSDDSKALEDFLSAPTPVAPSEAVAATPDDMSDLGDTPVENKKPEKTSEDLLSEFEKMLG